MEGKTDTSITSFIQNLEKLDAGDRACLKRSAGLHLAEARSDALGLFYKLLPYNVPEYRHDTYFMVAGLFPLAKSTGNGNFGASLRKARLPGKNEKGLDRRVIGLLDADENQLPFRLRQSVHFLQSNRIPVNWLSLLQDLLNWTHPDRYVQRAWAETYFYE